MSKEADQNISPDELERRLKEKKWEEVQIKGMSAWVNSYLIKAGLDSIKTLPDDISDGVKIIQFLELITERPGCVGNYSKRVANRIQKMENNSKVIKFIKDDLGIKLVGIGAEDIVDGNLMLVLGLLWSCFRKLSLGTIADNIGSDDDDEASADGSSGGASKKKRGKPEDDLLKWIKEVTQGYEGVSITNFKDSFNDGRAFAALIDRFDPEFLDYDSLDWSATEDTLNHVFDIAEKKLGIPKLLDAKDLVAGNPDERSVVLYSSLFYHAWTNNQERIVLANEKRGKETKISDMKMKLQQEEEERVRLKEETLELAQKQTQRDVELEETELKIKDLQALLDSLEAEKQDLKDKIDAESEAARERARLQREKIKAEIEKMTATLEQDLGRKIQTEEDAVAQKGKENIDLLAEKHTLLEQLAAGQGKGHGIGLGITSGSQSIDSFGLFGADAAKGGILDSVSGMTSLSALLREHVNGLHLRLKQMQDQEDEEAEKRNIEGDRRAIADLMKTHVNEVTPQDMSQVVDYLGEQFKSTNQTMLRILSVKDAVNELHEVVDKRGYLMAQVEGKRWKKRWFVLRGFVLYYYNKKEEQDDIAAAEGEISLENAEVSAQDLEGKPQWVIKLTVSEEGMDQSEREELIIGAKTKEERDDWLVLMQGKILYLQYLNLARDELCRPDTRIISLLSSVSITVLNLDELPLSIQLLKLLGVLFQSHSEIERISLVKTNLDDEKLAIVCNFLEGMPNLVSLNLSHNNITSKGAKLLAETLGSHKQVKILKLAHNAIDDEGLRGLARVFQNNSELEHVSLAHNSFSGSDGSLVEVAKALGSLKKLSKLSFQRNILTDEAAAELAATVLKSHPSIVSVKLQHNKIGDSGASAVFEALKTNSSVTKLNLAFNFVGNASVELLKGLFQENQVLRHVELSGNRGITGGAQLAALSELADVELPQFACLRV